MLYSGERDQKTTSTLQTTVFATLRGGGGEADNYLGFVRYTYHLNTGLETSFQLPVYTFLVLTE